MDKGSEVTALVFLHNLVYNFYINKNKPKFVAADLLISTFHSHSREESSMRKRLFLLISLFLFLILSACGNKGSISGEVVEATPSALILQTNEGNQVAVLLEENTRIFGMDHIDGDNYKVAPHTGVRVSFFYEGRVGSITTADGKQVKAYHAAPFIRIDAYLIPEIAVLSDGTVLDVWKTSSFGTTYQTKDGIELLREDAPNGPENHYVENIESFDDLSEAAKPHVAEFYEKQGKLYDLQAELERAWTAYQANPKAFSSFVVGQETFPSASNEQVFYFRTTLTQTISGSTVQEINLCAAFDRENGINIPLVDLFVCPEEDIVKELLDIAEKDGSGPADPVVKEEMETAFQTKYLYFSQDSIWLEFPQGTLPSQEYTYLVSVAFNNECKALLHPWAVPNHSD